MCAPVQREIPGLLAQFEDLLGDALMVFLADIAGSRDDPAHEAHSVMLTHPGANAVQQRILASARRTDDQDQQRVGPPDLSVRTLRIG